MKLRGRIDNMPRDFHLNATKRQRLGEHFSSVHTEDYTRLALIFIKYDKCYAVLISSLKRKLFSS